MKLNTVADLKKQLYKDGIKTYKSKRTGASYVKKTDLKGFDILAGDIEKTELSLFIDNDRDLYTRKKIPIYKNLTKKMKKDQYDEKLAPKAFKYFVEEGAKKYAKEFAQPADWNTIFDKATRDSLAEDYARGFEDAYKNKEYDFMRD